MTRHQVTLPLGALPDRPTQCDRLAYGCPFREHGFENHIAVMLTQHVEASAFLTASGIGFHWQDADVFQARIKALCADHMNRAQQVSNPSQLI